jgi:RNA polymerase sigma factor (sigma-70 family)
MDQQMIRGVAGKLYRRYVAGTDFATCLSLEELEHAGIVGYLEANRKVKPSENGDAGAYYYQCVKGRMLDLIRKQALVRIPQLPYDRLKKLLAAKRQLERNGATANHDQLAEKLGWSVAEIDEMLASIPKVFSADRRKPGAEDDGTDFYDIFTASAGKAAPQLETALKKEIAALISRCMAELESQRQLILSARYLEDLRLKELAERFACTLQAIHYQEKQALKQMRVCLEKNGWQWDGSESEP